MLDGLFMLLTLSIIMAIASFLAGSLPLSFNLSPSRLRLISTIGMGVLVGTALIVIIPEGVETLYSANDADGEAHVRRSIIPRESTPSDMYGSPLWRPVESFFQPRTVPRDTSDSDPFGALPGPVIPESTKVEAMDPDAPSRPPPTTPTAPGEVGILSKEEPPASSPPTPESEDSHTERTPHAWIGVSLIFGFILMFLLDTLPFLAPPAPARPQNSIYSLSDLSSSPPPTPATPQRSLSTTLGLCIHSAADGIALGASSTSSSTASLSLIIFVAIMVHKAPAAFGLTSVLLKQGLGKRGARAHLVFFSLAAPAGAVGTWLLVRALGGGGSAEPASMKWWTGVLLLFSGGTFLYVAMHTMQEEDSQSIAQDESQMNGYLDGSGRQPRRAKEGRSPRLVLAAVGGMLLPLITQIGHAH